MQRSPTKLQTGEQQQLSLIPDQKIVSAPVSLEHIPRLRDTKQALEYACLLAGVVPKEICPKMKTDKGTWSRICSGKFDLDGRDILPFSRVVGNDAYLLFLNYQHGYDLGAMRKRLDDKDREIAELKQEIADRDRAMSLWANAVSAQKGRGA